MIVTYKGLAILVEQTTDNSLRKTILKYFPNSDTLSEALTEGKEYAVQAIQIRGDMWWYYVHDDFDRSFPISYPAHLFAIHDPKLPDIWTINAVGLTPGAEVAPMISFEEWVNSETFFERLVDDDPQALATYSRYRRMV